MGEYLAKVKAVKFAGIDEPIIGLFPKDIAQQEKLKRIKPDEVLSVTFKQFRKKNLLDQAHAITHYLWANWRDPGHYPTVEVFRAFISIEVGYFFPVWRAGKITEVPETWSYRKDNAEFMDRLYNPLIKFASEYFKVSRDQLIQDSIDHFLNHK